MNDQQNGAHSGHFASVCKQLEANRVLLPSELGNDLTVRFISVSGAITFCTPHKLWRA